MINLNASTFDAEESDSISSSAFSPFALLIQAKKNQLLIRKSSEKSNSARFTSLTIIQ